MRVKPVSLLLYNMLMLIMSWHQISTFSIPRTIAGRWKSWVRCTYSRVLSIFNLHRNNVRVVSTCFFLQILAVVVEWMNSLSFGSIRWGFVSGEVPLPSAYAIIADTFAPITSISTSFPWLRVLSEAISAGSLVQIFFAWRIWSIVPALNSIIMKYTARMLCVLILMVHLHLSKTVYKIDRI